MPYDVFVSYNAQDHVAVEEIAGTLHQRGLRCYLDRWYLPKGQPWRSLLEQTLADSNAVAVFVGPQGIGPWQHREIDVALDIQARNAGFPVIPVLLLGSEPPLGFLRQNTWIDCRNQPVDQVILLLEKSIRGEPPGPELVAQFAAARNAICPYRGLLYFREEDAPFFFGRDAAIDELSKTVSRTSLVAVVGASGSGKSSVVRAGLAPRLRRDRNTVWEITALVPGDEPLRSLAAALMPFLYPELDPIDRRAKANKLAANFSDGSISLRDMVKDILDRQTGTQRLLLIADQWEELYTSNKNDAIRRRFLDEILDATTRSPLTVVLTLRGDFVGSALAYRPLSDRLQNAQVNLGPLSARELELAVQRPAQEVGLSFQQGLDKRVLADVGDEPGHLPLLEFVLWELWDKRHAGELLHDAYDKMGGLQGAIATKAEAFFEKLSPPEQEATRRLFLQLVHTSIEGNTTRRREKLGDVPAVSHDLVRRFADERLLVTGAGIEPGEELVEVAHEALLRNWKRLTDWLSADREFLLWRERLRALFEAWEHGGQNDDLLLRGPVLVEAEDWFKKQKDGLTTEQVEFITKSIDTRERREEDARLQQQRELERVEQTNRVISRQLGSISWMLAEQARDQAGDAIAASHLFAHAAAAFEDARDHGMVKNAKLAVGIATNESDLCATFANDGPVNGALFNKDESRVLTWGYDMMARLWAIGSNSKKRPQNFQHNGWVNGALFSKDESRVLTWSDDDTARLWVIGSNSKKPLQTFQHESSVKGALFSKDDSQVLTWSSDDTARLWAIGNNSKKPLQTFQHRESVEGALFSKDEDRVLTWSDDDTARLWAIGSKKPLQTFQHESSVKGALFSKEERRVLTWSSDGTARLWAIGSNSKKPLQTFQHRESVEGALFSKDEGRVLTWSDDDTARLWAIGSKKPLQTFQHESSVKGALFSKEERRVLTWSSDGTARLWAIGSNSKKPLQTFQHNSWVNGALFSKEENRVLTWGYDGAMRLWAIGSDSREPLQTFKHESSVEGAFYSKQQSRVLTWSDDGTARLWAIGGNSKEPHQTFQACKPVKGALFSKGDSQILTWGSDGTARLWAVDSNSKEPLQTFQHRESINGALFSKDESRVLTRSSDGTARLWAIGSNSKKALQIFQHRKVRGALFNKDESRVLTWGYDRTARLWAIGSDSKEPLQTFQHDKPVRSGLYERVNGGLFSKDESRVLTWSSDGTARLWAIGSNSKEPLQTFQHPESVEGALFGKDESRVLTWCDDDTARLWAIGSNSKEPLQTFQHNGWVRGALFSEDESRVLTWGYDRTARLWAIGSNSKEPLQIFQHRDPVNGALFSKDEGRVLTWSSDGTARLWAIGSNSKEPLQAFQHDKSVRSGLFGGVNGALFSEDESRVLTWSSDATARLWAIGSNSKKPLQTFQHREPVEGALFSEDESRVLTWCDDDTARLWAIPDYSATRSARDMILDLEVATVSTIWGGRELKLLTFQEWLQKKDELDALRAERPNVA